VKACERSGRKWAAEWITQLRPASDVDLFVDAMQAILDRHVPLLGTVALKGGGFIAEVKQRAEVELIAVSLDKRDVLPPRIAARFSA
jgi:hypothetical protein